MENNENTNNNKNGFFSKMYRTRLIVAKNGTSVINLSMLFMLIALLCAPWLVIIGGLVALLMGYKFSVEKNADGFAQDFDDVVKDAARNVKHAVDSMSDSNESKNEEQQG